jgi:hypothetical protein
MTDRLDAHPRELLSAYLDGELPDDDRLGLETHLAACPSCRVLLQDFRAMALAAAREQPPPVPGDFRRRIRLKIEAQRSHGAAYDWIRAVSHHAGLAAAAVVVLTIGLWALRRQSAPPGAPLISPPPASVHQDEPVPGAVRGETAPPSAPFAKRERLNVDLRSLGYVGSGTQAGRPAAPPTLEPEILGEKSPGSRSQIPEDIRSEAAKKDAGRIPPRVDAGDSALSSVKGTVAEAAGRPSAGAAPAPGETSTGAPPAAATPLRRLVLKHPKYLLTVSEDGTFALSTAGYACAVRRDAPAVDPEIVALFAQASAAPGEAPGPLGPTRGGAPVVRLVQPSTAAVKGTGETEETELPAGRAAEVESHVRAMLQGGYLALMQERCGEVPREVSSP